MQEQFSMNNRWMFTLAAAIMLSPACVIGTYVIDKSSVSNLLFKLMLLAFVWGGCFLLARWVGSMLWNKFHSSKAAMILAHEMGLETLYQKDDPKFSLYGRSFQGVPYAITPVQHTFRTNMDGEGHVRFEVYLRIVIPIENQTLSGVRVHRSPKDYGKAENFESVFPKMENVQKVGDRVKQAMFNFVAKQYEKESRAPHLTNAKMRNLGLLDRYYIADGTIYEMVFSDTAIFLLHDHPNPLSITPERLRTVLGEMLDVVRVAEMR
ncbi:MAG: hypothetical protein AAF664_16120 [Planctomycetota bacterium]